MHDFGCLDDKMISIRGRIEFMLPSLQACRAETMVDGLPRACRLVEVGESEKSGARWVIFDFLRIPLLYFDIPRPKSS